MLPVQQQRSVTMCHGGCCRCLSRSVEEPVNHSFKMMYRRFTANFLSGFLQYEVDVGDRFTLVYPLTHAAALKVARSDAFDKTVGVLSLERNGVLGR